MFCVCVYEMLYAFLWVSQELGVVITIPQYTHPLRVTTAPLRNGRHVCLVGASDTVYEHAYYVHIQSAQSLRSDKKPVME